MIALIEALPAGNAVRLILAPPGGAAAWRVLRRTTDTISGPEDPGAVVVGEWGDYEAIIDDDGLLNGVEQFYRVFYRDAAGQPILPLAPSRNCTPAATARDTSPDVLRILRKRVEAGLAAAVAAGRLSPRTGSVPLVVAPMVDPGKITLPIVSIHLERDAPLDHALADFIASEELAGLDGWDDTNGYLSEVSVNFVAVSLNPDERIALGKVLKHIMLVNRPVLLAHGILRPNFTLTHAELQPDQNAVPLYVASGSFSCIAPTTTTATAPEITDAVVTLSLEDPAP